jgi:hypothetical protein
MIPQVADSMSDKTEEIHNKMMSGEYVSLISGSQGEGRMLPKWERKIKAELIKIIENSEVENAGVDKAEAFKCLEMADKNAAA